MDQTNNTNFSSGPYAPAGSGALTGCSTLSSTRDALTNAVVDPAIEKQINSIIKNRYHRPDGAQPLTEMRELLEHLRRIPAGDERTRLMNSLVRTLGRPDNLAAYLDMLRDAATRYGSSEQELCKRTLQSVKMHSIYGWCGNTLLAESLAEPVEGTSRPVPGLQEKLGNPTAAWNLTLHIWQPNSSAKGFPLKASAEPKTILEPPHSHPFDFASMVVTGHLHQSIYAQHDQPINKQERNAGHYNETSLEHVDGVWPPHDFRETCNLQTLEHRILLNAGDSYYIPCNMIHDVEIDRNTAVSQPAITLFLSSEYLVMPHVYMSASMAGFHARNPDIKTNGKAIPENAWHDKLKAIAAYLRRESETLDLNSIVNYTGEYAFFHTL